MTGLAANPPNQANAIKANDMQLRLRFIGPMLACFLLVSTAQAGLTIELTNNGGTPPTFDGGGTLVDVMSAAAALWESAFTSNTLDVFVDVSYGWGALPDDVLARASGLSSELDVFGGTLTFDSDGTTSYFVDPTPFDNSEWAGVSTSTQDLGGGTINTGRKFTGAMDEAVGGHDLLTVALHELGHTLGWKFNNIFPPNEAHIITSPVEFAGTAIPIDRLTTHVNQGAADLPSVSLPDAVMGPLIASDTRLSLSGVDILLVAEQLGFSTADFVAVPESSSVLMVGLIGLLVTTRSFLLSLAKRFGFRRSTTG